jgi:hypothetical protein
MTTNRQLIVRIQPETWSFSRELRKVQRMCRELSWAMRFKAPTDEEQLAFRWAVAHVRAGRTDLAAEDLNWLGLRS